MALLVASHGIVQLTLIEGCIGFCHYNFVLQLGALNSCQTLLDQLLPGVESLGRFEFFLRLLVLSLVNKFLSFECYFLPPFRSIFDLLE